MATTIKLKNSVTTTNAPTSLVQGEVAINVTDKKVWVGNAATTPVQLLGAGADGTFTNLTVSGVASFADGTVSLPSITNIGDTNTGIFFPAADTIAFTEGGVEAMRIDSSANVGIGTSSPGSYKLNIQSTTGLARIVSTTGTNGAALNVNNTAGDLWFGRDSSTSGFFGLGNYAGVISSEGAYPLITAVNGSERMRIDSSGNLLVGTTSKVESNSKAEIVGGRLTVKGATSGDTAGILQTISNAGDITYWYTEDITGNAYVVASANGVYVAKNGTSWTAASDERVKDIIEPINDAVNKISTLRAVIGKYKTDKEGTRRSFLIAQDVQKVLPEAVDASNLEKLGLQYTDIIPLLVASIKELKSELDSVKAELQILKGK